MELKALYDMDDLLDLVEQDLDAKGFRLVGGLTPQISCQDTAVVFTLAIEQLVTGVTPQPAPAPAPVEAKPKTKYEMSEKRQEVLKKAREKYAEKKKAEKLAAKQAKAVPEVVAPATAPFHYQQPVPVLNGHSNGHLNQNS